MVTVLDRAGLQEAKKKKRKAFYGPKGFNLLADVENFLESRSKQAVEQDSTFQW